MFELAVSPSIESLRDEVVFILFDDGLASVAV